MSTRTRLGTGQAQSNSTHQHTCGSALEAQRFAQDPTGKRARPGWAAAQAGKCKKQGWGKSDKAAEGHPNKVKELAGMCKDWTCGGMGWDRPQHPSVRVRDGAEAGLIRQLHLLVQVTE